ncbi:hypothetical protein [Anaerotruncus sp. AF02-27]|uniref:hypothetical protein n=1 Tax=Anaerotruncus sp. AF02-27 TaxID=2292191 RepID=UPI0011C23F13|nr:hypothetical protein [Anaerotruncus sp. AF02-27]
MIKRKQQKSYIHNLIKKRLVLSGRWLGWGSKLGKVAKSRMIATLEAVMRLFLLPENTLFLFSAEKSRQTGIFLFHFAD